MLKVNEQDAIFKTDFIGGVVFHFDSINVFNYMFLSSSKND